MQNLYTATLETLLYFVIVLIAQRDKVPLTGSVGLLGDGFLISRFLLC